MSSDRQNIDALLADLRKMLTTAENWKCEMVNGTARMVIPHTDVIRLEPNGRVLVKIEIDGVGTKETPTATEEQKFHCQFQNLCSNLLQMNYAAQEQGKAAKTAGDRASEIQMLRLAGIVWPAYEALQDFKENRPFNYRPLEDRSVEIQQQAELLEKP